MITCFLALSGFAQTNGTVTEEKSSAWIKVIEDPISVSKSATVKKQTTARTKKSSSAKPATSKKDTEEEFEKTNQQVNRFKKAKKN